MFLLDRILFYVQNTSVRVLEVWNRKNREPFSYWLGYWPIRNQMNTMTSQATTNQRFRTNLNLNLTENPIPVWFTQKEMNHSKERSISATGSVTRMSRVTVPVSVLSNIIFKYRETPVITDLMGTVVRVATIHVSRRNLHRYLQYICNCIISVEIYCYSNLF